MQRTSRYIIVFVAAVCLAVGRASADLIVDSWSLLTLVHDFTPPASESDASYFEDAQTPFSASHSAAIQAGSYSTASYDIGWLLDEAHFDITTAHHLAQLDGETITEGRIFLTPSVDSLVTFSGNWQYAWPSATLGSTQVSLVVWDITDPDNQFEVASASARGGNFDLGPPFGTRNIGNEAIIHPGSLYMMSYLGRVRHFDPTPPSTFGEASGDFHFTITPIPEPAAAMLLLLPFLAKRSRRLR